MLLTSWIRALRQSFTRHRLSRARRKQVDARRRSGRHARLAEILEERSLLSIKPLVIDINQVTGNNIFTSSASTPGINITNSVLDPNNDGISDYDDLLIGVSQSSPVGAQFDSTVINGTGTGIRINLSNLTGLNHIAIDNVIITAGANQQGISITLDNVALQSLDVDQTNISPAANSSGASGLDINLKNMSSTAGVDVSIQNSNIRSGSPNFNGVNVTLESVSKATHVGELTLADSTVEGMAVTTSANSILYATIDQASARSNRIQDGSANLLARGITYNLNRTSVGDLRVEDNLRLRNVSVTTTDSPLKSVSISDNSNVNNPNGGFDVSGFVATDTNRDAIRIFATSTNAVGTLKSDVTNLRIVNNTITGSLANTNAVNGIALSMSDSNLGDYAIPYAGARISGNTIRDLSGTANNPAAAVVITGAATAAFVTQNGGRPLLLDFDGDGTANDTNGITQNTLLNNNGRGLVVTGKPDTSFVADVTENIIQGGAAVNRREGVVINTLVRPTLAGVNSFSLNFSDNTVDGSQGSGVSLALQDNAIGSFVIRNNEFTNTTAFTAPSNVTATNPNGLSIVLEGTNTNQEAQNVLLSSLIEGNFVGITRTGIAGPNAANGIFINSQEASIIQDLRILNNSFRNNGTNATNAGLQILREDKAEMVSTITGSRAVTISGNTFGQNRNGMSIDARNGSIDLLDFGITNNFIGVDANGLDIGNIDDGINLRAEADARVLADISENQIRFNRGNGINLNDRFDNFSTDKRQIGGTWINNTISENFLSGIQISGRHGLSDETTGVTTPLLIGQEGNGNLIENNGQNGIQIFGLVVINSPQAVNEVRSTATGEVAITNNIVRANARTGIFVDSSDEKIDIRHNQIESNRGKGIDLQLLRGIPTLPSNNGLRGVISATIRDNVVTNQVDNAATGEQGDGIEISGYEIVRSTIGALAENNDDLGLLNALIVNNFVDSNEGRGLDILNVGAGTMQVRIGDGTDAGRNTIIGNNLDGIRVVNTPERGQHNSQDTVPTAAQPLGVTRNVVSPDAAFSPDIVLDVSKNTIRDNGIGLPDSIQTGGVSEVNGSGLVILASGVGQGANPIGPGLDFYPNEVGANSGNPNAGNGRINLRVTNNTFEGNFGNDFVIAPYTAVIPPTTTGVWTTTQYGFSMYLDPLIRINAVVTGNTGNGMDVIRPAPEYTNPEPVFKSRLRPPTAPPGPFGDGSRPRNATRLAVDGNPVAPALGFEFVYPGIDERAYNVQTGDASLQLNNTFISQGPNANTPITTLRVESGFDQSGTNSGFAFYSPSAPGPGSDDNFDDTANLIANGLLPVINNRIDVLWDSVDQGSFTFPNVDSPTFVFPTVRNFPILGSSTPGTITVDFSEFVRFVDISDFRLFRNNVAVSLAALAVSPVNSSEDPNNPGAFKAFTIDLSSVTALPGNYEFQVLAVNPTDPTFTAIRDVHSQFNNQGNPLTRVTDGAGVLQDYALSHLFEIDNSRPTGSITPITPDPRNAAAGIVTVTFSEPVTGVDVADFQLFRDSGLGPVPVNLGSITLTTLSSTEYTLNLNQLTGAPGTYQLQLVTTDSSTPIQDAAANLVAENFAVGIASSDTWLVDTTLPFVTSIADDLLPDTMINSPVNVHPGSVIINFSEAVSGVENSDFTLLRTNEDGTVDKIDLSSTLDYPLFQLTPSQYELNLLSLPLVPGTYRLSINPLNSGITDTAGNAFLTSFAASWVLDIAQPLADIVDVAPDPRQTPVDALNTIFTEKVNGVNLLDASTQYVLAFDDGTAVTSGSISDATNAGPIVVTSMGHNLSDGERITIYGVTGNTNANGVFIVKNPVGNAFELWYLDSNNVLQPVSGNGIYPSGSSVGHWVRTIQLGGTVADASNAGPIVITSTNHGLTTGTMIELSDVEGNTAANGVFTVTRIDADSFSLNGSTGNGAYTSGGTWVRTTSSGSSLLTKQTDTRYVLNLSTVTFNQGTYIVSLLANSGITDDAGSDVGPAADQFNVAAQDIWSNGPDSAPTGAITPVVTPRGTNAGLVTVTFSEPLAKVNNASPVDFKDFKLTRGATTISLANVPITQTGPMTYMLDLRASGLTDVDGTYVLQLLNTDTSGASATPLKDLTGNLLSDDSDPLTAAGIANEIKWEKSSALSGPQVTGFIDEQRGITLGSITKLRPVQTLTINFSVPVTGIDLTDASKNFLLTRQATSTSAKIPVSLEGIAVQQVTTSQYRISLSTLTGTDGTYAFTVLANGLIQNTDPVPVELKNPQTVTWIKDGIMRPTTVGDSVDSNQGNEVVGSGSSYSLRQAIQEANTLAGDDVIELGAGTYSLSLAGVQEDFAASGDLDIRQNLVIRGKGVGVTIIDATALSNQLTATNRDRVFQILAAATVTIQGVTIQKGAVTGSDDGGAIRNTGNLTILDSLIQNSTSQDDGGAINNTGTLSINRTTISKNTAVSNGGAIRNAGTLFINNSTLSGNTTTGAGGNGGALMNLATFSATLENVTVSGNISQNGAGGGIRSDGTLRLINDTIAFNKSLTVGAGISRNLGTVTIGNTIVSNNTLTNVAATPSDVAGTFVSVGGNLIQTLGTATGFIGSDQTNNVNPNLLPLGNYGGPTQIHALPAFDATGAQNPAIDRGLNANVTNQDVNTSLDQRGALRFLDGPSNGNSVDVGAFEFGTFFVNTSDDSIDVRPGDGLAEDGLRQTSLRSAIMESNALAGESAIILNGQVYSLKRLSPDRTPPTVMGITGVPATPITTGGVGVVTITFSERVTGVDLTDIVLTRTAVAGGAPTPVVLSANLFQITKVSDTVYKIENKTDIANNVVNTGLLSVTQADGLYNLTVLTTSPSALDANGLPLRIRDIEDNTLKASSNVNWVRGKDTFAPTVTMTADSAVVAGGNSDFLTNGGTVTVTFSEKVTGVSANNFTLTRNGVAVTGLVVTPVTDANFAGRTTVSLNLQTLTAAYGNYVLTLNPNVGANVTIKDTASNNLAVAPAPVSWTKSAAVRFEPINDPRVDEVTKVRVQFTEKVAGVKLDDFTLTYDDGSGIGPQSVSLSQATLTPIGTLVSVPNFGNAAEQWELTFSNKQAARDGVYSLSFNGVANGNRLVTTATTNTTVVDFLPNAATLPFQIGEDQSRIGDLDVVVGAGRVQIFGKGKDDSTTSLGNPQARTVIDGNLTDRLFDLTVGANVAISGVEMINGKVVYERSGGAIRNLGTLTINDSDVGTTNGTTLQGNFADGNGGAIANVAPATPVSAVLQAGINANAVLLTVDSVASFPSAVPFTILVDSEQMQVTAVNAVTNELTVTRSAGSVAHLANATVTLIAARVGLAGSLSQAALVGDVVLNLANVAVFPNTTPFVVLIDSEQIRVTLVNAATNQFTVSRGFNGTTETAHVANSVVTLLALTTINRSNLQNNLAGSAASGSQYGKGGAIYNEYGAVEINEGLYSNNAAVTDGGAIYNGYNTTARLSSSTFTSNNAGRDGGAIYNNDTATLTINISTLSGNKADAAVNGVASDSNGDGGAIFNETSATLVLDDSLLQNNTARNGGALYNDDGTLVLNRDTFGVNSALENGGAIVNTSRGNLTLNQGLFTTNSASDDGGAIQNFGSLVVQDVAGTGTQFLSNEAGTDIRSGDSNNGVGGAIFNRDGRVEIHSATFTLNRSHGDAGVIFNDGDGVLTIDRTSFDRNSADGNGGVLVNNDTTQTTINEVSFANNQATADGGAIYNNSEFTSGSTLSLTIDNTTLSNNSAARGGAIFNSSFGGVTLTNSTLSSNVASVNGGGLANFGTATLLSDTLYLNDAPVGAGIANNIGGTPPFGPVTLKNTLVAGGTSGADIAGDDVTDGGNFVDGGHNLIEDVGTVTAFNDPLSGNVLGQNPQLDILRDNGGPTLTHALLFGSPARDAGDNFGVSLNDQRGLNRVFDGDGNGVATVDIGAFESGFVVNSFLDTVDQNPGDGINADKNGQSTLRAAIMEANARPGEDTIILGPGIFALTLPGRAEDFRLNSAGNVQSSSETGDLDVLDDLNIIGAGTDLTFIDAVQIDRLFQVFPGISLKLSNLTLLNGNATSTDFGGAIFNQGSTTLENVLVINSSAGRGGGIYNDTIGTLTITDSLFRGNQAVQQGGAIFNDGTLTLSNSNIGAASRLAAAISSASATTITLSDVSNFPTSGSFVIQVDAERMLVTSILNNTFTVTRGYNGTVATTHSASAFATLGNVANIHGGGLFNQGNMEVLQTSFSGNLAQSRGGGLYNGAITGALTAAITAVQGSIVLTKTAGLPPSGTFMIQVESEQMLVTSVNFATNTLNVQRGAFGTQPTVHAAGVLATTVGVNSATISQSTFLDNFASSRGAAIYNEEDLTIQNSTLSNNDSGTNAALANSVSGQVLIENSTVVDNVAYRGGGLANSLVGTVTVHNTIVANNASTSISGAKAPNVRGTFATSGNNFIGNSADSAGFTNNANFDQVGSGTSPFDPVLKVLTDNGGPTLTHTARTGSPIIDNGNNTGGLPVDQRGAIRPTNSESDIGAVEQQDVIVRINDVMLKEGNSGSTIFTFTLSLNKPSIQEVRVHYTLQGDTAFAGEDFVDASGDVVFAPNQLNQTLEVVVNGDQTIEPDEQFLVNLSVPSDATFTPTLSRTQAVGTILSEDTGFRITDVNRVELETGSTDQDYVFSVSIVGAKLAAVPGSLGSAADAVTTTISLGSVADFPTTVPFTILVDSEQMQVTAVDTGTNEFTVVRGINGTVAASHALNATVNRTFIASYTIADGTATIADADYSLVGAATGTLTFVAGPTGELPASQTVTVKVKGDNDVEPNENFFVNLSSADLPFEFDKNSGIGTIFNDDLGFTVSSPLPPTNESDVAPDDNVAFTVSLQERVYVAGQMGTPVLASIKANVTTDDGTAISGSSGDYTSVSQQVTFVGATTTAQVLVPVLDDARFESDETFRLKVVSGLVNDVVDPNAALGFGTGTISDNDPAPDQWRVFTDPGTGDIVVNFSAFGGAEAFVVQLPADTVFEIRGNRDGVYVANVQVGDVAPPNGVADDLFIVDFTTGLNPIPGGGMAVHGDTQNGADAVEFRNGTLFGLVTYDSFGPGSGRVTFDGLFVDYDGLEPVVDKTFAVDRVFNAPIGGSDDILLSSSGGSTTIKSATGLTAPTFESVTFSSEFGVTTNLVVNGGTGTNNISISGGDEDFPLSLTVNAGDGNDTVNLTDWLLTSAVFGGAGNDTITGSSKADAIDGGTGDDVITGGLGNDTLNGGIGGDSIVAGGDNDLVNGGDDKDTIQGNDGVDTINGGAGDDSIEGGAGSETVDGGSGNDTVSGGDGDDTVLGSDGEDVLSGGDGADSLDGGFGEDTMSGDAGNDIINGQNGSLDVFMYTDPTNSNINFTLTTTMTTPVFTATFTTPTETDTLTNTERANIKAGDGNNMIDASTFTGSVTMDGAGGNDTLLGGTGSDSIIGGLGTDSVSGGNGNDTINGGDGNDTLSGDAGDDSITGGVGTDSISGGTGNDYASGDAGNDVLTGAAGFDTLDGGDNNDTISGGDDSDSLLGGAGEDSISGDNGDDTIDAGDGTDTAFGNNGNDFVGGGAGNDTLQGNLGDDSVNGMDGEDTLDGNAGIDTLFGGTGDDSMISTDGNDELQGQGGSNDTFTFNGDATLGDVFTITRAGNGFIPLTGIGLARLNPGLQFTTILLGVEIFTLNLNGGNDLVTLGDLDGVIDLTVLNINGGDGSDTIDGSLSTSTTVAINANMGLGNDSVQGGAGADTILGDAGNDTIISGAGADSVLGGDGNDSINGNAGADTIQGGIGDDSIWGGSDSDLLFGQDGKDTIWGQGGDDTIDGGLANDFLDGGYGDSVTAGTGNDSIIGGWGNDKIAGRDGIDTIYGDSPTDTTAVGNDTINGGDGNDKIEAGGGKDLVQGGNDNDFINGGAGDDTLLGGSGKDNIFGGAGNDILIGEDGDDTLNGQGGTDTVVGGRGLGTDTHSIGDKRTGESINELFKITTARPSIFSELNF